MSTRVVLACLIWLVPQPLWAQMAVIDTANLFQATLQIQQLISMITLTTRDLAPFTEVAKVSKVAVDLQLVMSEVNQIAARMGARQGLYGNIGTLPDTAAGLMALQRQMTSMCRAASQDGLSAQSLLAHTSTLLSSLTQLLSSIQSILGSVAGLQSANGALAEISGHLALLQASTVSAHEGPLCLAWAKTITAQAVEQYQAILLEDYGTIRER